MALSPPPKNHHCLTVNKGKQSILIDGWLFEQQRVQKQNKKVFFIPSTFRHVSDQCKQQTNHRSNGGTL